MAINLDKMLADLSGSGEDIKVLALGTLLQCDFTPLAGDRDKLVSLRDYLEANGDTFSGDMGFLYRQVLEKFRDSPLLISTGSANPVAIDEDDWAVPHSNTPESVVDDFKIPEFNVSGFNIASPASVKVQPQASVKAQLPESDDVPLDIVGFGSRNTANDGGSDPFAALESLPVATARIFTQPKPAPTPIEIGSLQSREGIKSHVDELESSFKALPGLPPEEQVSLLLSIKARKHKASYEMVLELLSSDPDDRVLATCISVLSVIGSKKDVPTLRPYLGHSDSRVRANCIDTIGHIGSPLQVLLFVAPMTRDFNRRARSNANQCLSRLGRDSIIKLLQVLLTQDDVNIRKNAIYAIDNFQGPDVLKLLAIALKDKSEYIRMEVLNLLGRRSEPAVEMLISQATSDPNLSVKQLAATLLKTKHSRNQSPAHRIQLSGMVDTLDPDEPLPDLSVLQGCDVAFQVATLKKVAEQFTDDAYEYVCQLLETSTDTELTVHSIKALAAIGGQSDFHRLRDFLDSSNDVIKMAAIEGVSQIASPQDLLTYVTPQLRSESAAVKDVAMRNLMRFKPQILLGHFNRLLQAKNLSVKIIGIYALSCFSGDTVQKLLMSVSTVNHPDIRFNLARALKNRKEDWSLQLLSKMAVDSDNRVALAAQSSLAHLRGDKAAKIKDSPASPPPSPSVNVPHSVETGVPSSAISPSSFGGSLFSQGQSYKDGDSGIGAAIERAARPVSAIGDIANLKEAQAEQISEDDMLSKSFVGNLANLVSTSPTMSTLFGKLSDKKSSAMKELSELDKKQRAIFETMGRKVYDLCEKKVIDEPEFTKAVFVVQKHLKLQKEQKEQKGQKADTSGGFLLSLLGGDSSTSTSGSNVALKQQFVYLGKTAYRLRQNGGLQIPELSESYLDIQALEERISQLMKEG